jgi:hypothetical protein
MGDSVDSGPNAEQTYFTQLAFGVLKQSINAVRLATSPNLNGGWTSRKNEFFFKHLQTKNTFFYNTFNSWTGINKFAEPLDVVYRLT